MRRKIIKAGCRPCGLLHCGPAVGGRGGPGARRRFPGREKRMGVRPFMGYFEGCYEKYAGEIQKGIRTFFDAAHNAAARLETHAAAQASAVAGPAELYSLDTASEKKKTL